MAKWIEVLSLGYGAGDFPVLIDQDEILKVAGSIVHFKNGHQVQLTANGQKQLRDQLLESPTPNS